jgi:hypothetical protein
MDSKTTRLYAWSELRLPGRGQLLTLCGMLNHHGRTFDKRGITLSCMRLVVLSLVLWAEVGGSLLLYCWKLL